MKSGNAGPFVCAIQKMKARTGEKKGRRLRPWLVQKVSEVKPLII